LLEELLSAAKMTHQHCYDYFKCATTQRQPKERHFSC